MSTAIASDTCCALVPYTRASKTTVSELDYHVTGVRALWVEMIRRAAFDWVLYRNSRKLVKRVLAKDAFHWLFLERPGDKYWYERVRNDGSAISSFYGICDALGLNPETLRFGIRELTPERIRSLGKLPLRNVRYDASAEAGHYDLESLTGCPVRILGEVQLLFDIFDSAGTQE